MCYLWYLQTFPSLPCLYPMRQGIITTKKEWRFERREFQACFGQTGGFEASTPLLKGELGWRGREKSMLTQKSVLSIAVNPHGCKIVTQSVEITL